MIEVKSKLKKWGNSLGIVITKEVVKQEGLKPNQTVEILLLKRTTVLKDTFGTLKFKKSTDEIMRKIDEELWNE